MNKPLAFTKMCVSGNDFIVIDERYCPCNWESRQVKQLCHRRFGVGADQLLLIRKSRKADASMHIYNQDSSKAKQCGNGLCAVANLLLTEKQTSEVHIEVCGIVHHCCLISHDSIEVAFPLPLIKKVQHKIVQSTEFDKVLEVDVGNPHLVLMRRPNIEMQDFNALGLALQAKYVSGINVHALKWLSPDHVHIDHWERGIGITPSCGSGSIASVFAGVSLGILKHKVVVENTISNLTIEFTHDKVLLTGVVTTVFNGKIRVA